MASDTTRTAAYQPGQDVEVQTSPGAWRPATYVGLAGQSYPSGTHMVRTPQYGMMPAHPGRIRCVSASQTATTAKLDEMTTRDDWHGGGYLGRRARNLTPDQRAAGDRAIATAAEIEQLSDQHLWEWATSLVGTWYAADLTTTTSDAGRVDAARLSFAEFDARIGFSR